MTLMANEKRLSDARKIMVLVESVGWPVLSEYIEDEKKASLDYVMSLMVSKPELLTGRVAIRHGMRAKAFNDLREWIDDNVKLARRS